MTNDALAFIEKWRREIDLSLERMLPRRMSAEHLEQLAGKPEYAHVVKAMQKAFSEPVWDYLDRGGKRWRPALFFLFVEALGGRAEKFSDFAALPEFLHNGSIIVDDIEDGSETRRGRPALHKIFGSDIAINAGNFLYFLPFLILRDHRGKLRDETLLRLWSAVSEEMVRIHMGQGSDIAWHRGLADANSISEEEYLQMCSYKTGVLSRLVARMAVILREGSEELEQKLGKLGEAIGIGFQIQDDILNIKPSKEWEKGWKDFGEDITEGKRTLMVIHTLKKAKKPEKERLVQILESHTKSPGVIKEAVGMLERSGSIGYAGSFAKTLLIKAWEEAEPLIKESKAKETLRDFVFFAVEREV